MSLKALMRLLAERGAALVVLLLVVALGLDGALILTRLLGGASPAPAVSDVARPVGPRAVNPQLQLATIVDAHLFGTAAASAALDAPPTTMALILTGVIADKGHPDQGQAIIGSSATNAKLYSVGAVVSGTAHLHAVYSDRVLLERNGSLETLMLPRTPLPGAVATGAPGAAAHIDVAAGASLLAGLVRVQPVFSQGKLSGYRIFPGGTHGTEAFQQLGLQPGDLIVAINGTSLDDPARALQILQTLSSSGSAQVTISRNGARQEVNLNLATLSLPTEEDALPAGRAAPTPLGLPMRRRPIGLHL